jgi:hypothetical protein
VVEHPLDDVHRYLVADHPGADGVAELVRGDLDWAVGGVADVAVGEPSLQATVQRRPRERDLAGNLVLETAQHAL